jgi:hypothetical protein
MHRYLLVAVLVAACGASPGSESAQICSAITGLGGNRDDFRTILTTESADEAYAAMDRVSERTKSTIAALGSISAGPIADEADKLATLEEGLLPIIDQLRTLTDEASWAAATDAYTRWYNDATNVISDVVPRLESLGVHCT